MLDVTECSIRFSNLSVNKTISSGIRLLLYRNLSITVLLYGLNFRSLSSPRFLSAWSGTSIVFFGILYCVSVALEGCPLPVDKKFIIFTGLYYITNVFVFAVFILPFGTAPVVWLGPLKPLEPPVPPALPLLLPALPLLLPVSVLVLLFLALWLFPLFPARKYSV